MPPELLDEKDRKIISELDANARQADSIIAKKVGVSKQVANYRIQRLVDKKIISDFYTIINIGKLGFNSHYVFLQLANINKDQEKSLLEQLAKLDYVGWIVSGTGRWDVVLLIYADSISAFNDLLNEVINVCGNHLHEFLFSTLISAEHISYKFVSKNVFHKSVMQTEKTGSVKLDKKDKRILEEISQHARMSLTEISKKTKILVHVINYRLKKLIKTNIIGGFKPKLNTVKLGFQWHLLLIQFQNSTEKRKTDFINFCKAYDKVYYITRTIGSYNVMLDIHVKDTEEFKKVLLDLKEKFSDVIKVYESIIIFDEHKISYFPKNLL